MRAEKETRKILRRTLERLAEDSSSAWIEVDLAKANRIDTEIQILQVFIQALECHIKESGYLERKRIKLMIRSRVLGLLSEDDQKMIKEVGLTPTTTN